MSNLKEQFKKLGSRFKDVQSENGTENQDSNNTADQDEIDFDSSLNAANPHPCLSFTTAFLQQAIKESGVPESPYEVTVLRRAGTFANKVDASVDQGNLPPYFKNWRRYTGRPRWWRNVDTNWTFPGDVEVITIKNDVIRSKIEAKERVFEHHSLVGEVSPIMEEIDLDFGELENSGCRILAWRVFRADTLYMDRQGRIIADPMAR
ncbi:hypothetical protein FLONG3_3544 [Fusarium longipes]|uniref:Uncharacterized protein n=1 Tax=Fusarium longipes TaxID=694270 RepID=A0A395T120_9HYPO|nr:hypothetical protein FLONG3_3544 [Fusarium longipes]